MKYYHLVVDGAWGWWKAYARPVLCCVERVDRILHTGVDMLTYLSTVLSYDRYRDKIYNTVFVCSWGMPHPKSIVTGHFRETHTWKVFW